MKHRETEAAALKLTQDQSLRVDKPYLNTLTVPVLRAVLQQERITSFIGSKGKVQTATANKSDIIDEIVRHFEQSDKMAERLTAIQETGASSSSAGGVEGGATREKKEKKDKKAVASGSKKKK
jgi:hypothetical protein